MESLFNEDVKCPDVKGTKRVVVSGKKNDIKPTKQYKKKPCVVHGVVWYGKLVAGDRDCKGLMDMHNSDDLVGHLVICLTRLNTYNYLERLYAYFKSYVEFYEYRKKFTHKLNCFYEIVNFNQKPHFDIDMKLKDIKDRYYYSNAVVSVAVLVDVGDLLVQTLIRAIMDIMKPNVLSLEKDVLIYTSHGHDKLSYHIIIDHWCHHDHLESKAFFDKVILYTSYLLNGRYTEFVDNSVYSTNQAFRLLGSHKYDNNRVKIFQPSYYYRGELIKHVTDIVHEKKEMNEMQLLKKSLITFTAECNLLQSFYVKKDYKMLSYDITEQDLKEINDMLNDHFGTIFTIREVSYSRILLKRTRPSMCPICKRVHLHENPVVTIYKDEVQWSCRRVDKQKFILGKLSVVKEDISDVITSEVPEEDEEPFDSNMLSFGDFNFDLSKDVSMHDTLTNLRNEVKERNNSQHNVNINNNVQNDVNINNNVKNDVKEHNIQNDNVNINNVKTEDVKITATTEKNADNNVKSNVKSRSRSTSRSNIKNNVKKVGGNEQNVIELLNSVSNTPTKKKNISFDGLNPW